MSECISSIFKFLDHKAEVEKGRRKKTKEI